jgi:3-methyladenine DNA glycosylase AlkD/GNAT superfamily N-acetyltransferase
MDYERRAARFREQLAGHGLETGPGKEETCVAERGGEVLGFVTLGACRDADVDPQRVGEIWGIYLAPQHWRQGAGSRLCRFAEQLLASRGCFEVKLWVLAGNDRARRFYEAMGFVADGAVKVLDLDAALEAVRYGKRGQDEKVDAREMAATIIRGLDTLAEQRAEPMRKLRRAYSKELHSRPAEFVLEVAHAMVAAGKHPWIAYELIYAHRAAYRALKREEVEALGLGIDSWWSVDGFARTLSGPAWRDGLLPADAIRDWARSADSWWRRAALVSTVALNVRSLGGRGDVDRTLEICEMLAGDREEMVVKALSWALRALVVHDPDAVRAFLCRHGRVLAARVRREVTNKLETGLKNP